MPRHHPNFVIIHKEHRAIRQVHVRRSTGPCSSMCDASSVFSLLCFIVVTLNYAVVVILKFRYVCVRCGHIYLFFHARISQWIFLMQIRNTWGIMGIQSNLQLPDTLSSGHLQLTDIYQSSQTTRNCFLSFYSSIQRTPLYIGRGHFFTKQT